MIPPKYLQENSQKLSLKIIFELLSSDFDEKFLIRLFTIVRKSLLIWLHILRNISSEKNVCTTSWIFLAIAVIVFIKFSSQKAKMQCDNLILHEVEAFTIILFPIKRRSTLLSQPDTGSRYTSWSEVLRLRRRALTHWDCQLESRSHYIQHNCWGFITFKSWSFGYIHHRVGKRPESGWMALSDISHLAS